MRRASTRRIARIALAGSAVLAVVLVADPAGASGRVELAPYVEVEVRAAWFRRTSGTCPGAEIHRRSIGAVGQAICPGGANQPTYSHYVQRPTEPFWGDLYCIAPPPAGGLIGAGPLNDACGSEGEQCEVKLPGFVAKGTSLADVYCEKTTTRCPAGYQPAGGKCVPSIFGPGPDKAHRCTPPACGQAGNPIELYFGNKYQIETDYVGAGPFPLRFNRHYNLPNPFTAALQSDLALGPFGRAMWSHNYARRIVLASGGGLQTAYAWRGDGKVIPFTLLNGTWTPDADVSHRLERVLDAGGLPAGWRLLEAEGDQVETYDASGRLAAIANRAGLAHTLTYDAQGRLAQVADPMGRTLRFGYNADGFIATMTDPAGQLYHYGYLPDFRLSTVGYPGGATRTHHYEAASALALTGISDENGARFATFTYDGYGLAASTERAGGVERYTVSNRNSPYGATQVSVTDPLGTTRTYTAANVVGALRTTQITGPPCPACGPAQMTYDANGNLASQTDWNGNRTTFQYDPARNLEIARTEAAGTPQARTISTEWHPGFRLPTRISEPGRETTMSYDPTTGSLLTRTVRDTATHATRTWTYTYNANGQVLTADGPRTDVADVTTYTDYPNDDPDPGKRGNLATVTNALGHVIQITAYNAHGQPLTIVDPNGLVTTLAYDARQRLVARSVGQESTTFGYDAAGNLTSITYPDGSTRTFRYDEAHRLRSVNGWLHFALDAMGNRVLEHSAFYSHQRRFNALGLQDRSISPAGAITAFAYDPQGNLRTRDGPLRATPEEPDDLTQYEFDALNRLRRIIEPGNRVVQIEYDARDRITRIVDPRGLSTTYAWNGFDELVRVDSPDSGSSVYTYDQAGNLSTRRDARGKTTSYAYDALNRRTRITYADGTSALYAYDSTANSPGGRGRLSSISERGGALLTAWRYDQHGRVTRKTQQHGPLSFTVAYSYAATTGKLASMTYPSDRSVSFGHAQSSWSEPDTLRSVHVEGALRVMATRLPLHQSIAVVAFHPQNSAVFEPVLRLYAYDFALDPQSRSDDHHLGEIDFTYKGNWWLFRSDEARRLIEADRGDQPVLKRFGYDVVDRLKRYQRTESTYELTERFGYDANGNRTSLQINASNYAYVVSPTSNRLAWTAGPGGARSFAYDAAGNLTGDGRLGFLYDERDGRLAGVDRGGGQFIGYEYNALGERVRKHGPPAQVPSGTNFFVYDEAGRLLGEYAADGLAIQELVHLEDRPVLALRASKSYFIRTDFLGTPTEVYDTYEDGGNLVWQCDSHPFGASPPNDNPWGHGRFEFNLRFPGQYFDKESGLHYNYYRDYDPQTGRYVQADPIGLAGGINLYDYARSNPLTYTDPTGEVPPLLWATGAALTFYGGMSGLSTFYSAYAALSTVSSTQQTLDVVTRACLNNPASPACQSLPMLEKQLYQCTATAVAAGGQVSGSLASPKLPGTGVGNYSQPMPRGSGPSGPTYNDPRYPIFPSPSGASSPGGNVYDPGYNR